MQDAPHPLRGIRGPQPVYSQAFEPDLRHPDIPGR